jgi:hypothetical protein
VDCALGPIEGLISVIDEGSATGTHKFGLLLSLIEVAERLMASGPDESSERIVSPHDLAMAYLRVYWNQTENWAKDQPLRQVVNGKGDHAALQVCAELQGLLERSGIPSARAKSFDMAMDFFSNSHPNELSAAVKAVEISLWKNPVRYLQRLGGVESPFLYHWGTNPRSLQFVPGGAELLSRFGPILQPLIEFRFARIVSVLNREVVGVPSEETVYNYLFGSERIMPPVEIRSVYLEIQQAKCMWTGEAIDLAADADHVIPWARRRLSTIQNFVLSPSHVNSSKSATLLAPDLAVKWLQWLVEVNPQLEAAAAKYGFDSNLSRTIAYVKSVYFGATTGSPIWSGPQHIDVLTDEGRSKVIEAAENCSLP